MKIILIGPPGSGKGTQTKLLMQYFNINYITVSELIKKTHDNKIKNLIKKGFLINDKIVIDLVVKECCNEKYKNGFILDGFPRTFKQAQIFHQNEVKINLVINFNLTFENIKKRLLGRMIHLQSGRIYHKIYNPPQVAGIDDITKEKLIYRDDDKESILLNRLNEYNIHSKPVINFYKKINNLNKINFLEIDANKNITDIFNKIINKLQNK